MTLMPIEEARICQKARFDELTAMTEKQRGNYEFFFPVCHEKISIEKKNSTSVLYDPNGHFKKTNYQHWYIKRVCARYINVLIL